MDAIYLYPDQIGSVDSSCERWKKLCLQFGYGEDLAVEFLLLTNIKIK